MKITLMLLKVKCFLVDLQTLKVKNHISFSNER